jgi:hypothetical protein
VLDEAAFADTSGAFEEYGELVFEAGGEGVYLGAGWEIVGYGVGCGRSHVY